MNQNRQILIVALVFCVTLPALASTIVVPGAQLASEGNSNNAYPFNLSNFSAQVLVPSGTQRYQQVYGASEFASAGGPLLISAIAFRVDGDPANGQPFCIAVACGEAVRIDLSTTSKGPDQLDLVFSNNLGSSVSTVFNAPLTLSSLAAGGLHGFDVLIPFASTYLYDPSKGNLLLDLRANSAALTTQLDSQNTVGDGTSRVFTTSGGVNATTGNFADSEGLVTEFVFTGPLAIPEPGTGWLIGLSLVALFVNANWRSSRLSNTAPPVSPAAKAP